MRAINSRIPEQARELRIAQQQLFWPTLEAIQAHSRELTDLQRSEDELLAQIVAGGQALDSGELLQRQAELACAKAKKQSEIDRKWTLTRVIFQFMSTQTVDIDGIGDPTPALTPETIERVLVGGAALHHDRFEVLELG